MKKIFNNINMKSYGSSFPAPQKSSTKCLFLCMMITLCMTLITFTYMEVRNLYSDEPSVVRIVLNSFKSSEERQLTETSGNKLVLVNIEKQPDKEQLLKSILTKEELKDSEYKRKTREASSEQSSTASTNSYYEEQSPVVVYSKSGQEAPMSYRQLPNMPPKQDSYEDESFNDAAESRQDPYYGSEEQTYYGDQEQQPYYRSDAGSQYDGYDDSREDFPAPNSAEQTESEEGRASKQDSYYRQWHYANPPPPSFAAGSHTKFSSMNVPEKRKLQSMTLQNQHNRSPFPAYVDDYDYMPPHAQPSSQQLQAYHSGSSTSQVMEKPQQQEMTFLSILKTIKAMWDLYQAFISSWNTMAQRHNKAEELAKQKYKQQMQLRVQANKQKLNNKKNSERTTKNPRKPTTTTATTISPSTTSSTEIETSTEEETQKHEQKDGKVEPRVDSKAVRRNSKYVEAFRQKRQTAENTEISDFVGEGRYIKGDPLKGYYDFVITEGSYKFWAVFQVGTALLIIYSTFAAIYYSKVNPLVSDYDYTDYLGGGRSLTGGDLDFVDDDTATASVNTQQKSWSDWLPRTGNSLKFILDAIDKLPTDLAAEDNEQVTTKSKSESKIMK